MFHTYILYSQSTQKFYTGQTAELTNRLNEHNSGETKSIAKGIPWIKMPAFIFPKMAKHRYCKTDRLDAI